MAMINATKKWISALRNQQGFTFLEMLVVVAIFSIMTTILTRNFAGFQSSITQNNLAHDMALVIQQTKTLSIAATDYTTAQFPAEITSRRGIHFGYSGGAYESQAIIFADADADLGYGTANTYDPGVDVVIDTLQITTRDTIDDICVGGYVSASTCGNTQDFSIVFQRAQINAILSMGGSNYNSAEIHLTQPNTTSTKSIFIRSTGQVTIR